tara:strand:+ start:11 stop:541 length:531 start_codon:yes stop_codon:yes gene_type:complete
MSETTESAGTPPAESAGTPPAESAGAPSDTAAQFAELRAQIAALTEGKSAAEAAAESARVAAMSDADKLAEERAAFTLEAETTRGELRGQRLDAALDKLGVLPRYRGYVGDVDPGTAEGKATLEAWAADHPEAVKTIAAPTNTWEPRAKSVLQRIASGEITNALVPAAAVRKLMGR